MFSEIHSLSRAQPEGLPEVEGDAGQKWSLGALVLIATQVGVICGEGDAQMQRRGSSP